MTSLSQSPMMEWSRFGIYIQLISSSLPASKVDISPVLLISKMALLSVLEMVNLSSLIISLRGIGRRKFTLIALMMFCKLKATLCLWAQTVEYVFWRKTIFLFINKSILQYLWLGFLNQEIKFMWLEIRASKLIWKLLRCQRRIGVFNLSSLREKYLDVLMNKDCIFWVTTIFSII